MKIYYVLMYELTNAIMLLAPTNRSHFAQWWEASEYYRRKRDTQ